MLRCVLVGIFCLWQVSAQAYDTLRLHTRISSIDLLYHSVAVANKLEEPFQVWPTILNHGKKLDRAAQGFVRDIYWIAFTIQNQTDTDYPLLLELDNPQIDVYTVYEVTTSNSFKPLLETGDRFPFHQRLIQNRNFLLPIELQKNEVKTFLLKIDKRNSSVSIPLYLWDRVDHREKDYRQNLGFGLYLGFMLLCLIYSLLTFIFLRSEIYWWYMWWIVFSGLFGFTALGFSHQFLFPSLTDFNSKFRVYVEIVSLIAALKFLTHFLNLATLLPRFKKAIHIAVNALALILLTIPFFKVYDNFVIVALPLINLIMLTGISLIIYGAYKTYRLQKRTVLFFFVAFSAMILATFLIIFQEFGVISLNEIPFNPYMLGSSVEILLFSIGLTSQIKEVYDERNELTHRIARQQKEMMRSYVEGIEKERSRIAGELHDDIGSRLGNLRRVIGGIQHDQKDYLETQVEKLSNDVRSLSHQLAPAVSRRGLAHDVEELMLEFRKSTSIQFSLQCYDLPEKLPAEIHQQCYRMLQEALNNILKHAKASVVDVQFFIHDHELVITVEDDGVGFDVNSERKNLGLRQLQARTESINGVIEISSAPGSGTQIMIRVPLY